MINILFLLIASVAGYADPPAQRDLVDVQQFDAFTEPIRKTEVCAAESGRLDGVFVRRGDTVEAGTILMQLDNAILTAQREISQQEADSRARLDALIVEQNVRDNRLKQLRELLADGAGSQEEVKRAEADAAVAKLNVDAGIETRLLAKLKLAEIEARLRQRQVLSPIAGLVVDVLQEPGEYVSASAPHVATIVQLKQLRATFFLPTNVAAQVTKDAQIEVTIEGHATPITATVEYIAAITEADSGRVRVDLLIENDDLSIRSGLRCVLSLPTTDRPSIVENHDA